MKTFLSEKGNSAKKITLVESGAIICEDNEVSETLNSFFAETVKSLDVEENKYLINSTVGIYHPIDIAIKKFISHPSILKIREKVKETSFSFSNVTLEDVELKIKLLNPNKANTFRNIPVKNLKENVDITGNILHKIIHDAILNCYFPDKLKMADISPNHKKEDMTNKDNYRPISILPSISKLFERLMQNQIADFIDNHLYVHVCGYRKGYSTQHALLALLKKWKITLDKGGYAGAIIMDLSTAFDTINHELLLAKLHEYGFDKRALQLIKSDLTNRWHRTRIN